MKAFICDLCGKFTGYAHNVGGLDFKIGERHNEFTGTHAIKKEVKEICPECYGKIITTVKELYKKD